MNSGILSEGRAVQLGRPKGTLSSRQWTIGKHRQYDRLLRREIPPIRGQLYSLLEELTDQRLSDDRFRQLLDSELITLMVEESVGKSAETLFQELVGESFVRIQAGSEELLEPLHVKGAETIGAIRGEVTSEETRKVFARTGLDVRSCLTLRDRIVERKDLVQEDHIRPRHDPSRHHHNPGP